ncbi:MAG: hypothetical protein NC399_02205 [Muribaculum sp.]|nr:hypothetical protein [Muribaculum sp.]
MSIFMVQSVTAVPTVKKLKRDNRNSSDSKDKSAHTLFAQILEEAAEQAPESAPRDCRTTLYSRDSRLQNFHYLSREYHY